MTTETIAMPCCGRDVEILALLVEWPGCHKEGEVGEPHDFYVREVEGSTLLVEVEEPFARPNLAPVEEAAVTCPACYHQMPPADLQLTLRRF